MKIAILLYENMTALDAMGPYEVLSRIPGAEVRFAAESAGNVRTDTGFLSLVADFSTSEVPEADVVVVPGGPGDEAVRANPALLDWVRKIHATTQWTTSVCTGALILGAAGILEGVRATTHWARLDKLAGLGAVVTRERVVADGKIMTAAGVSAGIDMALSLARKIGGEEIAQAIQLGIEYDPQPPFDAGSPQKAPAHVVELVTGLMA